MGTKVQIENHLPGHYSMRDLSLETNGAGWPSCYGDSNLSNGQFYYGFLPRTIADSHPGYDKDVMKQTMLEHEAVFKDQVYELHRLYRVQRDLMDEVKRKEQLKQRIPYETSSSSSPLPLHMQSEDALRCNGSNFALASPVSGRPLISGPDTVQSSPNSAKGKSIQAGPSPYQNCYSPKNSEVSESRPTKFRRRMLDLQLPADEYIDTDEVEQVGGAKDFEIMSSSPDKNLNSASCNGKMFLNYPGKIECQTGVPSSDLHFSKAKPLADLNEPLHVEEMTTVSSVDFLGRAVSHSDVSYRDHPTRLLGSSKDIPQNSKKNSINGMNNMQDIRPNGQDWFRYALESERYKASVPSNNQGIHPDKAPGPSQPVHILLDQARQPPAFLPSDHVKGEQWKAKSVGVAEKSDRSYSLSSHSIAEPIVLSHASSQPGLFHHSDLGKLWDPSTTSWGKANFINQKHTPVQTSPFLSKSSQSSAQSNDLFGNKWNLNSIPGANAGFVSEPHVRNGFYQGPSAAFKELAARFPPAGFDYVNCNGENTVPSHSNNSLKATGCIEVHPVKEMNLNVALPNGVSGDYTNLRGRKIIDEGCKPVDPPAVLPWLRGKGVCNSESANFRKGLNSLDPVLSHGPSVASSSYNVDTKAKKPDSSRKILGFPIFDNPPMPKQEITEVINPPDLHHQSGREEIRSSKRKRLFDINIPCEPIDCDLDDDQDKKETKDVSLKNHFDLNSCIMEEESPCETSVLYNRGNVKVGTGIDLEAPVTFENEDVILPVEFPSVKEPEKQQPEIQPDSSRDHGDGELVKSAAAAIVAISSCANSAQLSTEVTTCLPPEAEEDDPLSWFVSIACSSGNDADISVQDDGLPKGLDDFEYMILRLKECSVEESYSKPSIPDYPIVENASCVLTTRTRKGQGRRGRQKRDFQRDILPGLTTLSRHEVTEDLQTFGGLMRATGYSWQSGPNRRNATRNGCGRGRRRSVAVTTAPTDTVYALPSKQVQQQQQVHSNNTEVGLEDRSLTGWGKTTRRPRRQRCPAGNPALPVPLT